MRWRSPLSWTAFAVLGLGSVMPPAAARASCYEVERCFLADPAFRLFPSPYVVDGEGGVGPELAAEGCGLAEDAEPPPIELSRDPFVTAADETTETGEPADRDRDFLDDRMELELAETFVPFTVYADEWAGDFDGDPDFGEPTVLFQVRPYVQLSRYDPARFPERAYSCLDPVPAQRRRFTERERWVRIVYLLLWDRDEGYDFDPGHCRWHWGDNQSVTVLVRTTAPPEETALDPRWWRIHAVLPLLGCEKSGADGVPLGWPVARTFWFNLERGVHPVVFISAGKHHWSFEASLCQPCSGVFSPFLEDLACPWEWANPKWHSAWWTLAVLGPAWDPGFPQGSGVQRPILRGNRARELTRAFLADSSRPERFDWERRAPLGNNVGEWEAPDPAFVDALDWLCLWRVEETASGVVVDWSHVCFDDESAWDDRPFAGGHVSGDRYAYTVPHDCDGQPSLGWPNSTNRSHWVTNADDDIEDLDDDGVPNAGDSAPFDAGP